MAKKIIQIYKGKNCVAKLLDDVYTTMKKTKGEIFISGVDEKRYINICNFNSVGHIARLANAKIHERVLVREGDLNIFIGPQTDYRWFPRRMFYNSPLFVYSNKLAMLVYGKKTEIIIIKYKPLADAYRRQFLFMWGKSKKIKIDKKEKIARRKIQKQIFRNNGLNS